MSTLTEAKRRYRVTVDGTVIPVMSDVTISESMDQLSRVAEFGLAYRGGSLPSRTQAVLIEWIDLTANTTTPIFGGEVDSPQVTSQPWSYRVRCVDQLSKLRRTRSGSDLELTGMTDIEAWKAIADYCGVTYDDADIHGQGIVLGVRAPLYWLNDGSTPGSQMIQELDGVFRCNTLTIGADRVIRQRYNPYPSEDDAMYQIYQRGTSLELLGHQRGDASLDEVQNVWQVTGATIEESSACTTTPWAKAIDGNAVLGGKHIRVSEQSFSSDFIQDQSLAEAIARWKMGETNREVGPAAIDLFNDPFVHPGTLISIIDETKGMGADQHYYLVRSVDRQGPTMSLDAIAGPAGSAGTVTSGMDLQCNDTSDAGPTADDGNDLVGTDTLPLDPIDPVDPDDFPDDPPLQTDPNPVDEPIICSTTVTTSWKKGTDSGPLFVDGPWRGTAGTEAGWQYIREDGAFIHVDDPLIARMTGSAASIVYSSQPDRNLRTSADDVVFPALSMITICAEVAICGDNTQLAIGLLRADTGAVLNADVTWQGGPTGFRPLGGSDPHLYSARINIPNGDQLTDLDWQPSPISGGAGHRNTGKYAPYPGPQAGAPSNTNDHIGNPEDYEFSEFCAAFDLTQMYQKGWAFGDGGEGQNVSEECLTLTCVGGAETYSPNSHDFKVVIDGSNAGWVAFDCPPIQVKRVTIGEDCVANDDYKAPWDR